MGHSYGWKKEWPDTAKTPLEDQIGSVFRTLTARAEEQEHARLKREAEQQRLREERERQETERWGLEAEQEERERRELGSRCQRRFDQGGSRGTGRALRYGL
ncbi:hypothetical protein ACIOJD_32540 [Streptomyces sp. NPDC088116]|uniref:hypothetical protein n=1 Tax=Streptomyces sp. NPDC088116 TaxID=3365825 RepID=UPI0038007F49